MTGRSFSDAVQFSVVKQNLEKNHGIIQCELCGKQIFSIKECHFDHILPYSKGGKSTSDNCQILCIECNLKKSNKDLQDIVLEEKARQFLSGKTYNASVSKPVTVSHSNANEKMSKERFDQIVGEFIKKNGDIHQIDFSREYNHLPGISYVVKYYKTLNELKKSAANCQVDYEK